MKDPRKEEGVTLEFRGQEDVKIDLPGKDKEAVPLSPFETLVFPGGLFGFAQRCAN
jgi:hypothetical protein